jgi:hypothetical protein
MNHIRISICGERAMGQRLPRQACVQVRGDTKEVMRPFMRTNSIYGDEFDNTISIVILKIYIVEGETTDH